MNEENSGSFNLSGSFDLSQTSTREFLELQTKVDLEVKQREKKRSRLQDSVVNSVTPTKWLSTAGEDESDGDSTTDGTSDQDNKDLVDIKVTKDLFCWKSMTLLLVEVTDHKVDYIKVYTKHLYDSEYMLTIHTNYSNFLNDWEEKVRWTVGELRDNDFWKKECIDAITTFLEVDGLFQQARKELDKYNGLIVIHALSDIAFFNALKIRHAHIGSLFRWAGLCTSCRMYIDPDVESRTFNIITEFGGVNGDDFVWKFK